MDVCRTRATILLSFGEVLCCAERDSEWISYSMRSPEVLIKKKKKSSSFAYLWVLWFSNVTFKWRLCKGKESRGLKEGTILLSCSVHGVTTWHFCSDGGAVSLLCSWLYLPVWSSKPLRTLPNFLGRARNWYFMKLLWNLVGCQDRNQGTSLVVFAWQKILCGLLLIIILCTTDIFSSKDMQILIGWAIPCIQFDGVSLFIFV